MQADNVRIAPLNSADLDSVSALYHAIWHETQEPYQDLRVANSRDLSFFKSRLQHWQKETLVARVDSELAGFTSWEGPALEALYIAPQFRSSGLGAKLLAKAEVAMRKSGASELSLDCVCLNIAGRKFYERNGWRILKTTGLPDGIHQDITTQHWLMTK
ncbi:MAG: GNAT family N-acetyltransferase [Aestuariivirga sp.]